MLAGSVDNHLVNSLLSNHLTENNAFAEVALYSCFFWYNFLPTTAELSQRWLMALSARIPGGSDLTGLCRHKLEGIFDMHGVKIGSRADIPGFLEKLFGDRYFAMDFWALVESLEDMRDKISEEQIRRTVAECVGGWLPKGDPAVAGIDEAFEAHFASRGWSTAKAQPAEAPVEPGLRIIEHVEYKDSMQGSAVAGEQAHPVVELGAAAANSRIDQILSRLELNDHELKLLLESIESRISRLEPHVEELAAQVVSPRGSAAAKGRAIHEHGRLAADRVGQRLAATNVAMGVWGTRIFGRMDSGLEKAGHRFAAMDVAAGRLRSRAIKSLDSGWATVVKAEARGRVAVARAMKQCWAVAMIWVEQRRAMLVHVSTTLGVVACLALVIWLWGRPRGFMARATPVAASSAIVPAAPMSAPPVAAPPVPAATVKTEPAKTQPASVPSPDPPAEAITAPTPAVANVSAQVGSEAEPSNEVRTAATKVTVAKRGDYTAPPWIKWYDDDGAPATPAKGSGGESPSKTAQAAQDDAR
jgi:hypothetical protein